MIVTCPSCSDVYAIPPAQIAALVQVACPHCEVRIILDFAAANDANLREPDVQTTSAYLDESQYRQAVGAATSVAIDTRRPPTSPPGRTSTASPQPLSVAPASNELDQTADKPPTPEQPIAATARVDNRQTMAESAAAKSRESAAPAREPKTASSAKRTAERKPASIPASGRPQVAAPTSRSAAKTSPHSVGTSPRPTPAPASPPSPAAASMRGHAHPQPRPGDSGSSAGKADEPNPSATKTQPRGDAVPEPVSDRSASRGWQPATSSSVEESQVSSKRRGRSTQLLTGMPATLRDLGSQPQSVPLELTARIEPEPPQPGAAGRPRELDDLSEPTGALRGQHPPQTPDAPAPSSIDIQTHDAGRAPPHSMPQGPHSGTVPPTPTQPPSRIVPHPAELSQSALEDSKKSSRSAFTIVLLLIIVLAAVAMGVAYIETGDINPLRLLPR